MRGLFIDLDGTLADSLPVMYRAYELFLADFGATSSLSEFQTFNGPPLIEIVAGLRARHHLAPPHDELLARYRGIIAEIYREVAPADGARDVLHLARGRGWGRALVTSSDRATTTAWLARHDLGGLFDLLVTGDDVAKGKPDPEPYLAALKGTGADAALSLAVEDSEMGAEAALGAGIPTLSFGAGGSAFDGPLWRGRISRFADLAPWIEDSVQ